MLRFDFDSGQSDQGTMRALNLQPVVAPAKKRLLHPIRALCDGTRDACCGGFGDVAFWEAASKGMFL